MVCELWYGNYLSHQIINLVHNLHFNQIGHLSTWLWNEFLWYTIVILCCCHLLQALNCVMFTKLQWITSLKINHNYKTTLSRMWGMYKCINVSPPPVQNSEDPPTRTPPPPHTWILNIILHSMHVPQQISNCISRFAMGIEFREGSLLITPKNSQTAKKGKAFHFIYLDKFYYHNFIEERSRKCKLSNLYLLNSDLLYI